MSLRYLSIVIVAASSGISTAAWKAVDLTPPASFAAEINGAANESFVGDQLFTSSSNASAFLFNHGKVIDLSIPSFQSTLGIAVTDDLVAGDGFDSSGNEYAIVWSLNGKKWKALNSGTYQLVSSNCAYGSTVGGSGYDSTFSGHALVWRDPNSSPIDITPVGTVNGSANAITVDRVLGQADTELPTSTTTHAYLWHRLDQNPVDLNPSWAANSVGIGMDCNTQVGVVTNGDIHPALWHGSAQSCVDLLPAGFQTGYARAVDHGVEVGTLIDPVTFNTKAALWRGTSSSYVDLSAFVPAGFISSEARAVVVDGDKVTVYGIATDLSGDVHAYAWINCR